MNVLGLEFPRHETESPGVPTKMLLEWQDFRFVWMGEGSQIFDSQDKEVTFINMEAHWLLTCHSIHSFLLSNCFILVRVGLVTFSTGIGRISQTFRWSVVG